MSWRVGGWVNENMDELGTGWRVNEHIQMDRNYGDGVEKELAQANLKIGWRLNNDPNTTHSGKEVRVQQLPQSP